MIWRFVHVSWLIALTCLAFVAGVWLAKYINTTIPWPVALGAFVLLLFCLWRQVLLVVPVVLLLGSLLGLFRGGGDMQQLAVYHQLYDRTVEVTGTIREDTVVKTSGAVGVYLGELRIGDGSLPGLVYAQVRTKKPILRGDTVTIKGKLQTGFGSFAGSMYGAELVDASRPYPGDMGRRARDWFAGSVQSVVQEPQASLGLGFLLGQKSALPDDLAEAMRIVGLTHIVVASGYNLTILVQFARRLLLRVSRFAATIAAGAMVLSFMAVTGLSPSMSRACLVAGLSLLAWYMGRQFHPIILLSIAAGVTVMVQPSYAWGDVGWQLSFAAFAGVMLLAPILQQFFFGDDKPGLMRQLLGETLSAYVSTLPILMASFGQVSFVAIIANMLVVPLVPLAMLATFIVGVLAFILPPLAEVLSLPLEWLLGYMVNVAMFLSELPWAKIDVQFPDWTIWAMYAGIITITTVLWWVTKTNLRRISPLQV